MVTTYNRNTICVGKHGLKSVIHTDVIEDTEDYNTVNFIG